MNMTKTTIAKSPGADRGWVVLDADGQPLGRLAVRICDILRGKDKPTYTPHVDTGGFVVVVNAAKVRLTGRKEEQKTYARYSGYRGGLKEIPVAMMRERHPDRMIHLAVRGMLPKNTLSRKLRTRLKVYAGPEHPHAAQKAAKVESK
jgi:large subunit ribosomal protein L13